MPAAEFLSISLMAATASNINKYVVIVDFKYSLRVGPVLVAKGKLDNLTEKNCSRFLDVDN